MKKTVRNLCLAMMLCLLFSALVGCGIIQSKVQTGGSKSVVNASSDRLNDKTDDFEEDLRIRYLDALKEWQDTGSEMSFLYLIGSSSESSEKLGENNRINRVVHSVSVHIGDDNFDPKLLETIRDMAINILEFDTSPLDNPFVSDSQYLFSGYGAFYNDVYPLYDLASGTYGLYNSGSKQYVVEPGYTSINVPDENGYMLASLNGYFGYLDMAGNKVVGFYYDSLDRFDDGYAIASLAGNFGIIDTLGNEILPLEYRYVYYIDDFICVETDLGCGLLNRNLDVIIPPEYNYTGFEFINNCIYATWIYTSHGLSTSYYTYCDLYDMDGNYISDRFDYNGVPPYGITLPENGVSVIKYVVKSSRLGGNDMVFYRYFNDSLEYLTDSIYSRYKSVNELGYAVAQRTELCSEQNWAGYTDRWLEDIQWQVISKDGTFIRDLPDVKLRQADNWYVFATRYYAYATGYQGAWTDYGYALVNIDSGEVCEYKSVEHIEGNNCFIVQDMVTGLYGLIDGGDFVYNCDYNSITYSNGQFEIVRGAEKLTYDPIPIE